MRALSILLPLALLTLGACSSAPPMVPVPAAPEARPAEFLPTDGIPPAVSGEACADLALDASALDANALDASVLDASVLFDATPTSWVPAASRLLGCASEALAALNLGAADSAQADGISLLQYTREQPRGRVTLVVAIGDAGAVGVSIAETVPRRLTETVFTLRAEQAREAAGAEPIPSPEGTRVFPASGERPYGVRLVRSQDVLVLSVVRE